MAFNFWKSVRGVTFVFLVFNSSYFGTIFLLTPILPLFLIAPEFTRKLTDEIVSFWKLYLVSILEVIIRTKVKVHGRVPSCEEAALIIMNHRTRFDWLFLFSYQIRHGSLKRYIISMKQILKYLPGVGWAGQIAGFIFLDRKWEEDKVSISRYLRIFSRVGYRRQILLFPEGTDLTTNTKKSSDDFADRYELPHYKYVLHPRTTGFVHFVQEMRKGDILNGITNITVGYCGNILQTEMDMVKGNFPSEVHFLIDWYSNEDVPSQKDQIEHWCKEQWQKKEAILKEFYERKSFNGCGEQHHADESLVSILFLICWLVWTSWNILISYILWCYPVLWLYVIACTFMYVFISKYTQGCNFLIAKATGVI